MRAIVVLLAAVTLAGTATAATVPGIRTPSGNVRCVVPSPRSDPRNHGGLWCRIDRAAYSGSLARGCNGLDWHGWVLSGNDAPEPVCSGGALWFGTPRYRTLAYGRVWRHDGYVCRSARVGLTCTNRAGHGLFVSRETWRSW